MTTTIDRNEARVAMTLDEAAERYSCTRRQLRAMIARGTLPAIRPTGTRAYLVRIDDLERAFAAAVRTPQAKPERETPRQRELRQLREAGFAVEEVRS